MDSGPTVIIVEDDVDIRESLEAVLAFEGFSVIGFSDGKAALDFLRESPTGGPFLILLDLMMPVMSGWKFLEVRKEVDGGIEKIPVYLVSAIANPEVLQETGALGFIRKPVDLDRLVNIVRDFCTDPSDFYVKQKKVA